MKTGDRQDQLPLEARMVFIFSLARGRLKRTPLTPRRFSAMIFDPFFFGPAKILVAHRLRMDCAWIVCGLAPGP